MHREQVLGNKVSDTEKLSSSKHKHIKQWSKYATLNTELGGDEVMHIKTIDTVGDHMADAMAKVSATLTKTTTTADTTTTSIAGSTQTSTSSSIDKPINSSPSFH